MSWDLLLGTTTLHVSFWPMLIALAGALVSLDASLRVRGVLRAGADTDASHPDRARWRYALLGLAPLALVLTRADLPRRFVPGTGGPVLVDCALALLGGLLAGRTLDWLSRSAGSPERARAFGLARAAWAGGVVAQVALVQAGGLLTLGALPELAPPEPALVQIGRTGTFVPRLVEHADRSRSTSTQWTPIPFVVVGAGDPGSKSVRLRATPSGVPWLSVSAPGWIRIAQELGDARLPLRVGNRWRYEVRTTRSVGGLVSLLGDGPSTTRSQEMRVAGGAEIAGGGVRVFRLVVDDGGQAPQPPRGTALGGSPDVQVFAADGELFYLDGQGASHPLFSTTPSGDGFSLLSNACSCAEVGPLRGPTLCMWKRRADDAERLIPFFLSFGIVAPGDEEAVWILDDTRAGADDAPSVTPSGALRPCPLQPVIGPGDDAPPEVRPTWREHVAAAPRWAPVSEALPFTESRRIFEAASADPRPAQDAALLACKVSHGRVKTRLLFLSFAPSLNVSLRLGDVGPLERHNGDDRHDAYLTGPVSLRGGERISAHLVDRDASPGGEDLGDVTATVEDRLPARAKDGLASIECRGVERPTVEAELTLALALADRALKTLARDLRPDLGREDLGLGRAFGAGRRALEDAAVLVGWADPRVARRLAWERRLEEAFTARAAGLAAQKK